MQLILDVKRQIVWDVLYLFPIMIITDIVWLSAVHHDVNKWKHIPRYWPFVREIHWSPVNCPHKGQWRGALMFSLICAWLNGWVNNRETGVLRRHRARYDAFVVSSPQRCKRPSNDTAFFLNVVNETVRFLICKIKTTHNIGPSLNIYPRSMQLFTYRKIQVIMSSPWYQVVSLWGYPAYKIWSTELFWGNIT